MTPLSAVADRVVTTISGTGCLFPPLSRILEVSAVIAAATAEVAYARGLAAEPRPKNMLADIRKKQYQPVYRKYA